MDRLSRHAGRAAVAMALFGLAGCAPVTADSPATAAESVREAGEPTPAPTQDLDPSVGFDTAGADVSGHLLVIHYDVNGNQLLEVDLSAGRARSLFVAPPNGWLAEAALSPDGRDILLVYAPPPPNAPSAYGFTDLYLLAYPDGGEPRPLLLRKDPEEAFFLAAWSPDGAAVYYTHLIPLDPNSTRFRTDVGRVDAEGATETLIENAYWPVPSPDGSRLAFLKQDPMTSGEQLVMGGGDGTDWHPVFPEASYVIDAPLFSPDGRSLLFSMVNGPLSRGRSWLEVVLGIEIASAHSLPSDWYVSPVEGGSPQRLTNLVSANLRGDVSPDGRWLAFVASSGLYLLDLERGDLILLADGWYVGGVDWIP